MPRKQRPLDSNSRALVPIDEHVLRLREMLAIMAPETGTPALGASFTGYQAAPRRKRLLMLPSPDAGNF